MILTSLNWVQVTAVEEGRKPFWCYTDRLLLDAHPEEQQLIVDALKGGKIVYLEASNTDVRALPMPLGLRQRLAHLLSFETADFKLTGFREDLALFSNAQSEYYSMNEMAERGFLPKSTVSVNPLNTPIYQKTTLVDVFIPVAQGPANFQSAKNVPL